MFDLVDKTLENYLRAEVPLSTDIDIVFERPDRLWSASVTRPTVNLFLWDLRRNASEQEAGMETVVENGRRVRRPPLPRMDCRYLVTTWAGEVRDAHSLLGAVAGALLSRIDLPVEHIPNGYRAIEPGPTMQVARFDGSTAIDIWTAIEGEMRPSIDLTVTATVDAAIRAMTGPDVRRFELETTGIRVPGLRSRRAVVSEESTSE